MPKQATPNQSSWLAVILLTLVGASSIAILCANAARKPPLIPATLYLRWEPQAQFAGYYVAESRGFFRDEGIDVTIKHDLGVGESFYEILSSPHVYAINNLSNTIEWLGENQNFSVLSVISKGCNMGWLTKGSKSDILKRMRTGRFFSWWGSQDILLKNFLIEHNLLSRDALRRMTVGSPKDTTADDWLVLVMRYNELLDYADTVDIDHNFVSYCELGQPIFEDILVGRNPLSNEDSEINHRMARAVWRGWDWTLLHPQLALDHLMRINPRRTRRTQEHQLKVFSSSLSSPGDRATDYPEVQRTLEQLLSNGLVKTAGNAKQALDSLRQPALLRDLGEN